MAEETNAGQATGTSESEGGGLKALGETLKTTLSGLSKGIAGGPMGLAVMGLVKIGEGIMSLLSKITQMIIDSSPYLQGILSLISTMFKLVLMPVGNMIARLLMPLAIKLANKTIKLIDKYSNSDPDSMVDAATDGFSIITESMVEMIGSVLGQVLWPLIQAGAYTIGNLILSGLDAIFGTNLSSSSDYTTSYTSAAEDLEELLGSTSSVLSSTIDQFGLTILTGNSAISNSAGELATVIYSGSSSIEDGFQSTNSVFAMGTTEALGTLSSYNIANAGLVESMDTTILAFENFSTVLQEITSGIEGTGAGTGTTTTTKSGGWNWLDWTEFLISPIIKTADTYLRGDVIGGRVSYDTTAVDLSGINGTGANSSNITVEFSGTVYGYDDFEDKVSKIVSKQSSKLKTAY